MRHGGEGAQRVVQYDENMRIKVCDFGLSEFQIEEEMFEKEPKGCVQPTAPRP